MKVITLVTTSRRDKDNKREMVPPGTEIELDDAEAKDLIGRKKVSSVAAIKAAEVAEAKAADGAVKVAVGSKPASPKSTK